MNLRLPIKSDLNKYNLHQHMSTCSYVDLIIYLYSRECNIYFILLTANAMIGMKEEYLAIGFNDYLGKPVRGESLEKMIIKWLPEEKYILI